MQVQHPNGKPQHFDEHEIIRELKHYLPTQTTLKDFIHHLLLNYKYIK